MSHIISTCTFPGLHEPVDALAGLSGPPGSVHPSNGEQWRAIAYFLSGLSVIDHRPDFSPVPFDGGRS